MPEESLMHGMKKVGSGRKLLGDLVFIGHSCKDFNSGPQEASFHQDEEIF